MLSTSSRLQGTANGDTRIIIDPSEFVDAATESGNSNQGAARFLFVMSFFTLLMDVGTALYKPPRGVVFEHHRLAYYLALASIFIAGLAEVCASWWLARSGRRSGLARALLVAAVVPFVVVAALGGFTVLMKS